MALLDNYTLPPFDQLRVISYSKYPGKLNMAIDHYFASNCHNNMIPLLRFYGWDPYCLSIGYHQKMELINVNKLIQDGFDAIRRPTGGRAIFHAKELTYCIIAPKVRANHHHLYQFIHWIFSNSLNQLGYPVELKSDLERLPRLIPEANDYPCFTRSAQTEVQFEGKKIIGSAQKIYKNSILQHGSLLIGGEHEMLPDYLLIDKSIKTSMDVEISKKTTHLGAISQRNISIEKLITSIINQLDKLKNISLYFKQLNQDELRIAEKYAGEFSLH